MLAYVLSFVVAFIMTGVSVVGLLYRALIYPSEELFLAFAPTDVVNLAAGLPILLGSMWLTRRGKLIGLLCWPGALIYVLYIYVAYIIGVPYKKLFLPYLVLLTLSLITLINLIMSIDGNKVRRRLSGKVPVKTTGSVFTGIGVCLTVRLIYLTFTAVKSHTSVETLEFALWIADFTIIPVLLAGGFLLWGRKALGYVAGAGLLFVCSMLFIAVIPVMVFQARSTASPVDVVGIIVVLVMGMVCFIPFALFVRGATSDRNSLPGKSEERS